MASRRNQKKTQKVANAHASQEVANVPTGFARMTTPQFKAERVEAQAPNVTLALAQAFSFVEESAEPSLERMSTEEFKEMREMAREAREDKAREAALKMEAVQPANEVQQTPKLTPLDFFVQEVVLSRAKSFEPMLVKVKAGAAHMVVRVGNVLLYVETQVGETCTPVKVWVVGKISSAQDSLKTRLEPLRPAWVGASSRVLSAKDAVLCTLQPHWIRAHNGFLYVQTTIGNTLVRVKVSANDRIIAPVILALARVQGAVSGYTVQLLAKAVALYDVVRDQFLYLLTPLLERGNAMAAYTKTMVNGTVVAVKARAATVRDSAQAHLSPVYMKVKNGVIYMHALVGDKVFSVRISLTDLVYSLTAKALEFSAETRARVFTAKARIQDTAMNAAQIAKCKVDTLTSQVHVAVTDRSVQVTTVGAIGGAASMGVSGGAAGLATGSVIGAACGLPAAFFTFGLSIPIAAAVGGATGLCAGAVTGGAVGLVGGGATARTVHKHSDGIKGGAAGALNRASGYKHYVSQKAKGYTDSVAETTMRMKSKLVGGTGSTSSDSD